MKNKEASRVVFLDYLRVIAIFMVLLLHSCELYFMGADGAVAQIADEDYWWLSLFSTVTRVCVPLFVMASGYLLLPLKENQDIPAFFKKRFVRVFIPFAIVSLCYLILPYFWGATDGEAIKMGLVRLLFNFNGASAHLWFVYMILGLYMFMPVLSPWLSKVGKKGEQAFLAVWLLASTCYLAKGFLPQVLGSLYADSVSDGRYAPTFYGESFWNEFSTIYYFSGFIGYLVLAHYIRFHINWSLKKSMLIGGGLFMAGFVFTAIDYYYQLQSCEMLWQLDMNSRNCTINVVAMTFGAFVMLKHINYSGKGFGIIEEVSNLSFGVYLWHIFFLVVMYNLIDGQFDNLTNMLLIWISTMIITLVFVKIVKLLPKGKYLVG